MMGKNFHHCEERVLLLCILRCSECYPIILHNLWCVDIILSVYAYSKKIEIYFFFSIDPRVEYFEKYEKYCKYLPVIQNNPKAAKYIPSGKLCQS